MLLSLLVLVFGEGVNGCGWDEHSLWKAFTVVYLPSYEYWWHFFRVFSKSTYTHTHMYNVCVIAFAFNPIYDVIWVFIKFEMFQHCYMIILWSERIVQQPLPAPFSSNCTVSHHLIIWMSFLHFRKSPSERKGKMHDSATGEIYHVFKSYTRIFNLDTNKVAINSAICGSECMSKHTTTKATMRIK